MDSFDPYYNWLGIPPRDQPPNHYRLLGLELFESHPDVIQNASDRQMAHLRTLSTGKRAALAQNLLNQVAAAKICLLDPVRKAKYDESLQSLSPSAFGQTGEGLSQLPNGDFSTQQESPVLFRDFKTVTPSSGSEASPSKTKSGTAPHASTRSRPPKNPVVETVKIIGGGILGLALGFLVVYLIKPSLFSRSQTSNQIAQNNSKKEPVIVSDTPVAATPSTRSPDRDSTPPPSGLDSTSTPRDISSEGSSTPDNATRPQGVETNPVNSSTNPSLSSNELKTNSQPMPAEISTENSAPGTSSPAVASSTGTEPKTVSSTPSVQPSTPPAVAAIPETVDLPQLGTPSWLTLFPVGGTKLDGMQLVPSGMGGYSTVSLTLDQKETGGNHGWSIRFEQRGADTAASVSADLAQLQLTESAEELQFLWKGNDSNAAAALRNSWLTFYVNGEQKWVALRRAKAVSAPKLDFNVDRQILPLTVEDCPPVEQLELEVAGLASLSATAKFRKDVQAGKIDRNIIIEFTDLPGAEIRVQLKRSPPTQLAVVMLPRFKENASQEFDLTYPQLEKTRKASDRTMQESRERIAKREAAVKAATSELNKAKNARGSDRTEKQRLNVLVNQRIADLREAERQLKDANLDFAKAQARLQAVSPIETFLNALQDKPIPFRVLVRGSSHELVLVEGRDGATSSTNTSNTLSGNAPPQ